MKREQLSEIVGRAFPPATDEGRRLRRFWHLRSAHPLPDEQRLESIQCAIVAHIREALRVDQVPPEAFVEMTPALALIRLDSHHLVARIDTAGPDTPNSTGAAMAGTWGTLQELDRYIELEDVQGLPATCWWQLRAARAPRAD